MDYRVSQQSFDVGRPVLDSSSRQKVVSIDGGGREKYSQFVLIPLRSRTRPIRRHMREVRMVARALKSTRHPVLAHIVPVRRCNLSCTYCNEFDTTSVPVPTEEMLQRIDHLARLGTAAIHLSGGEPLLHPQLDAIIERIGQHGIFSGVLTNGYLLTVDRIRRLNRAGLDHLQ